MPGADAYPMVATVFVLMNKGMSAQRRTAALNFFDWSLTQGSAEAAALGYVPLPSNLVAAVKAYWADTLRGGGALTDAARDRVRPRLVRAGVGGAGSGRRPYRRGLGSARARPVPGRSVGYPVRSGRRLRQCDTVLHADKPATPAMGCAVPALLVQRAAGDRPASGADLKVNLVPEDKGVGVGLYFSSGVNLRTGDLEVATLLVPVTISLNDHFRLNLNAGWQYLRIADTPDDFFWGAQVEAKVGEKHRYVGDVRARPRCSAGQMGVRWRPNDGPINFDFLVGGSFDKVLAGEFLDKVSALFFTVGVTLRW